MRYIVQQNGFSRNAVMFTMLSAYLQIWLLSCFAVEMCMPDYVSRRCSDQDLQD